MSPIVLVARFRVAAWSPRIRSRPSSSASVNRGPRVAQHVLGIIAVSTEPTELRLEHLALVRRPAPLPLRGKRKRARIEFDLTRAGDGPGAEGDGGTVTLTNGPGTHREPDTAGADPRLVRMHHHARIAQRGTLEGVFAGEGGPEQQPTGHRDRTSWIEVLGELVSVPKERVGQAAVTGLEPRTTSS